MFQRVLIVTGGRDYMNEAFVRGKLEEWQPDLVVHGGATGADTSADRWARQKFVPRLVLSVEDVHWRSMGKGAGPTRNGILADIGLWFLNQGCEVELVAMPGNAGTNGMVDLCIERGIVVWDFRDGRDD